MQFRHCHNLCYYCRDFGTGTKEEQSLCLVSDICMKGYEDGYLVAVVRCILSILRQGKSARHGIYIRYASRCTSVEENDILSAVHYDVFILGMDHTRHSTGTQARPHISLILRNGTRLVHQQISNLAHSNCFGTNDRIPNLICLIITKMH